MTRACTVTSHGFAWQVSKPNLDAVITAFCRELVAAIVTTPVNCFGSQRCLAAHASPVVALAASGQRVWVPSAGTICLNGSIESLDGGVMWR